MKKPSDDNAQREQLRQSIIGLGEKSLRKSYYPELKKRIIELEQSNKDLKAEIQSRIEAQAAAKKLEKQLQQSQKMEAIGTLAGGIAHDFNNILTIITGYAELAQLQINRDCEKDICPIPKDITHILDAAERAKELVTQILAFSRNQDYEKTPLILNSVIHDALTLLRPSLPQSIKITTNIDTVPRTVLANETQLHQIIFNLSNNAHYAMAKNGGLLTISLKPIKVEPLDIDSTDLQLSPGHYTLLTISDNGCGMNQTTLDRAFDPYFTTKPKGRGTGMGLSVVHGIVKNHDGHINIYSEVGEGTSVQLYFPEITSPVDIDHPPRKTQIQKGSEKILLVDDEPELVLMQQRILESLGYTVDVRTAPHEALALFINNPQAYDLVITDMTMPQMNGAQLAQAILNQRPDLPIILCTGFSDLINESKAKAIGIREFVMKPIIRQSISAVIRKALVSSPLE